jgi:hypothetical protein
VGHGVYNGLGPHGAAFININYNPAAAGPNRRLAVSAENIIVTTGKKFFRASGPCADSDSLAVPWPAINLNRHPRKQPDLVCPGHCLTSNSKVFRVAYRRLLEQVEYRIERHRIRFINGAKPDQTAFRPNRKFLHNLILKKDLAYVNIGL